MVGVGSKQVQAASAGEEHPSVAGVLGSSRSPVHVAVAVPQNPIQCIFKLRCPSYAILVTLRVHVPK